MASCDCTFWLVRVDDQYHIYAANIISPENPSGANQVFLLYADANVVEIESLQIFDRWGNLVFANDHFYANDENEGWDGTFRGKQVQAGVFVWMAKVVLADGKVAVLEGSLTVIR